MKSLQSHLPEEERAEIQAKDTEVHRVKQQRVQSNENKRYKMHFDTTEEEYS